MFTSTITIEGRLADEPTVLENLTEFVVLTNRRKTDETGEWVTADTSRFTVKSFRTLGVKAGEQLHKGDQIIVAGSIVTDTWKDNDTDQNRHRQTLLADAIGRSI